MSKRKAYVPPAAEMILLAPCERLAAWEYSFQNTWTNIQGRFNNAYNLGGGSGITGTFTDQDYFGEDGFTVKQSS
ncbi:MAG: hypothetical protein IJE22_04645 [Oscillibacter sp.]|nr:hypothetical protein [Oscillibacter sp.]